MKRFVAAGLILAMTACAEPLADRFPAEPGASGNHVIWVVSHGWHTGIVVDRAEADALRVLGGALPEARYLEIGWGDIGFYTAPADGITAGLALEALFASRGSVLHVVGLDAMPERAFPAAEVERMVVSDLGFRSLIARIDAAFDRDGDDAVAPLRPGIYGDSRFYRARGRYWALNTCNNWTAAVLRETGCPITSAYALTAGERHVSGAALLPQFITEPCKPMTTQRPEPGDEVVDIVDESDRVVGAAPRREVRAKRLKHRCVFIAVRSTRGHVLIHRRSDAKDLWPGRWDLAAGGVLAAGEGWEDSARRELQEELGIVAPLVPLGSGAFADADVDVIARIYAVRHDGPFAFSDGEVVEAFFVSLDDLAQRIERDPFVPDSVALVWPLIRG